MLIEIIFLLFLVTCCLSGYRKGLIMSLGVLLILVLSSLGATVAQQVLAPKVTEAIEPKVQQVVYRQLQQEFSERTEAAVAEAEDTGISVGGQQVPLDGIAGFLGNFGIDLGARVAEGAEQAMEPTLNAAAEAVAHAIVEPVAELVIYVGVFLILYLLLHSVTLALNIVERLPVIHTLNRAGGAVFGLLGGVLVLTVLMIVCRRTGWLPDDLGKGPLGLLFQGLANRLA